MTRFRPTWVVALAMLAGSVTGPAVGPAAASAGGGWTGTWATVPTAVPSAASAAGNVAVFEDQTLRQAVHVSVGGDLLRVRLSNEFGDRPLVIGAAHVAHGVAGESPDQIAEGTDRTLTFGGRRTVTVPAGAPMLSDPVALPVPAGSDLVVSVYLPERTEGRTIHAFAFRHNVVAAGDVTGETKVTPTSVIDQWYFLTGVSVRARRGHAASIVALGDSITDGANTTVGADRRWPDLLAARLRATRHLRNLGVLNEGISGNRLLHDPNPPPGSDAEGFAAFFGESALRRFDRDVGAQPGAKYVIVFLGVNDLGHPGTVAPPSEEVSAADIIGGFRQLIARAHDRGLKVFGATILPFRNDTFGFFTPEREAARQAVNAWIRTGGEYDAVIDFDAALRDPARPDQLLPAYDSGDHLHPNDAGAAALADAVRLRIFR
ncbi:MAG TPA: SGNH/GDSL hydrolase family protein [Streptosporangiaceae bacterium]|nr:SGNH/GDSL hydrolase family protein [Streptosporangiaceae bacterium]